MASSSDHHTEQVELQVLLRIRVAVLENELKHEKVKGDDAMKSLAMAIRAFAIQSPAFVQQTSSLLEVPGPSENKGEIAAQEKSAAVEARSNPKTVMKLEQEIEILRREIRNLKGNARNHQDHTKNETANFGNVPGSATTIDQRLAPFANDFAYDNDGTIQPRLNGPVVAAKVTQNTFHSQASPVQQITNCDDGMVANTSNVEEHEEMEYIPSSPRLSAEHSAGVANVGIRSLEDVLDGRLESWTKVDSVVKKQEASPQESLPSENREFSSVPMAKEEENDEDKNALKRLQSAPTPSVLKTGFDYNGFLRRDIGVGHHVARNHDRFASSRSGPLYFFKSTEERLNEIESQRRLAARDERNFPDVFRHGITYTPNNKDTNLLQTVHIGNLPSDIHLRDVLARVRGGKIVSAVFLDTKPITGSMSVLIRFAHERAADQYFKYTGKNPISFGEGDNKVFAEVTLLSTPTYPINLGREIGMAAHNQTRCLALRNFSLEHSIEVLEHKISYGYKHRANSLLEMYFDENTVLHLEFASISLAASAFVVLKTWNEYYKVEVQFEADPCAKPVEELLLDAPKRKPLFPKGGFINGPQMREEFLEKERPGHRTAHRNDGEIPQTILDQEQRKQLAKSPNQKLAFPLFKSSSWADEVNDEYEASTLKTPEILGADRLIPALSKGPFNESGLAASKYATVSSNAMSPDTYLPRNASRITPISTINEVNEGREMVLGGNDGDTNGADRKEVVDVSKKAADLKPVSIKGAVVEKDLMVVKNPEEIHLDCDSDSGEQGDDESEEAAVVEKN